ncbi:unnamed protein product [Rangifer tarandus platyrhynchus]|uniref:Uncharacterized protein n=1 Tax=Rangifer tarandus platyrhynchus TaxID=3082113 RepID=A0AC59ZUI3_RANTA
MSQLGTLRMAGVTGLTPVTGSCSTKEHLYCPHPAELFPGELGHVWAWSSSLGQDVEAASEVVTPAFSPLPLSLGSERPAPGNAGVALGWSSVPGKRPVLREPVLSVHRILNPLK